MADNRKIRKPLMEKKRRARINESLEILKNILIEFDPDTISRTGQKASKLEKADVLEMTVNYLQKMTACRRQYPAVYNPASYRAKPYSTPHVYQQQRAMRMAAEQQYQMFQPTQHRHPESRDVLDHPRTYVPIVEMVSPPTSPEIAYHETPRNINNCNFQGNNYISPPIFMKKEEVCEPMWRPW